MEENSARRWTGASAGRETNAQPEGGKWVENYVTGALGPHLANTWQSVAFQPRCRRARFAIHLLRSTTKGRHSSYGVRSIHSTDSENATQGEDRRKVEVSR